MARVPRSATAPASRFLLRPCRWTDRTLVGARWIRGRERHDTPTCNAIARVATAIVTVLPISSGAPIGAGQPGGEVGILGLISHLAIMTATYAERWYDQGLLS